MGICISDLVHGLLGLLPVTLAMGRNTVGYATGANHKIFNLLNFLIILLFFFVLLGVFGYIPRSVLKALNFTNAYLLWESHKIFCYWKHNKVYQLILVFMCLGVLLTEISTMLVLSMVLTTGYYIVNCIMRQDKGVKIYWHNENKEIS